MEQWNDGILGPIAFHSVEKQYVSWDRQNTEIVRFNPLFHFSNIPLFHAAA